MKVRVLTGLGLVIAAAYASQRTLGDAQNLYNRTDYLNAPGILSGGLGKSEAIARRIAGERSAGSNFELALIAERRKQYADAEAHLQRALEVGRVADLAQLLATRGWIAESDALFARAKSYTAERRNLTRARQLPRQYLELSLTPDDPSGSAETLLRRAGGG